jgi:hypothetical protein
MREFSFGFRDPPERGNGHKSAALFCYEQFEEQLREFARTDPEKAAALAQEVLARMRSMLNELHAHCGFLLSIAKRYASLTPDR